MDVSIGPGAPREADLVTALHHRAARVAFADIFPADAPAPDFDADRARWRHALGPDSPLGLRSYVARIAGGVPVGVVLAGPDDDEPGVGHMARLYVDPDQWSVGIGTMLYGAAMDDLGARFDAATLWVLEGNARARAWYERLGWRMTPKRTPTYTPAGIEDVQYRIDLVRRPHRRPDHRGGTSTA